MRLTSNDALKLIESERKNTQQDRWINHSICVGNIAGRIAEALKLDSDYAGICIKHSFLNNDIDCISNDSDETDKSNEYYDFVKQYISSEYSIYEKIINLCDLMCTTKILTVDKRMMDLLYRHGVYAKTHYHIVETLKLKEHFDNLLGYNLYDLFSEIKENL
mgnify:CR=1 FL=1